MTWEVFWSCAPLTGIEVQCADVQGTFWLVKTLKKPVLSWVMDSSILENEPFNLENGDPTWCKVRGRNKNGAGSWSYPNFAYYLESCESTDT
jgi:hypothetical protein